MKGQNASFVESIIKKAISGSIRTRQVAATLGCSKQYVNKLKREYRKRGNSCFIHGNKGKERRWKTNESITKQIVSLYKTKYQGFNFAHYLEKLTEIEKINISYGSLYRILKVAGFNSPKKQKKKKSENIHPSRARRENFGELIQIDASFHNWFGDDLPKATLHGAIDDATGMIVGMYFDKEETLLGYFEIFRQILTKYGIPETFYSDNRTVFEYQRLQDKDKTIDRNFHIQFKRACQQLGVSIITTSVSQAKGRIEREWGTAQSRLISELRLRGIKTIESANEYLPQYIADSNRRFAIKPHYEKSVFAPPPSPKEINYYLSVQYQRMIDNGSGFKFKSHYYQLANEEGEVVKIPSQTMIDIYVPYKGEKVVVYNGKLYSMFITDKAPKLVANKVGRPKWVPGPRHPWRKFVINPKK